MKTNAAIAALVLLGILGHISAYRSHDAKFICGTDFPILWAGGKLAGTPDLYSSDAVKRIQRDAVGCNSEAAAFIRLPFFAVFMWPFSLLPVGSAFWVYRAALVAAQIGFIASFGKHWKWALLACVWSFPLAYDFDNGQDVSFLLLEIAVATVLLGRGRSFAAGMCLALCAVKFHLMLFLPLALFWRDAGQKRTVENLFLRARRRIQRQTGRSVLRRRATLALGRPGGPPHGAADSGFIASGGAQRHEDRQGGPRHHARDWRAVGGMLSGGAILFGVSVAVAGWNWPMKYAAAIANPSIDPAPLDLHNIRGLVGNHLGAEIALGLTVALAVWIACRWGRFEIALCAALCGGVLVSHHMTRSDWALLLPVGMILGARPEPGYARYAAILLITPAVVWLNAVPALSRLPDLILLSLVYALAWEVWRGRDSPVGTDARYSTYVS